jgi:hypothetical protein
MKASMHTSLNMKLSMSLKNQMRSGPNSNKDMQQLSRMPRAHMRKLKSWSATLRQRRTESRQLSQTCIPSMLDAYPPITKPWLTLTKSWFNTFQWLRILNIKVSSKFSMMQTATTMNLIKCWWGRTTYKISPKMSFTKCLDMPSDKTIASHSKTFQKSIGMPTFALNCVEYIMIQEPSKELSHKIKRKRKRGLK